MADTSIEWATKVWNFVRGCRRVSPGCGGAAGVGGCYAEKQANRFKGPGQPYEGLVELGKQGPRWTGKGLFVPEKLAEPLSWKQPKDGSRHRVFVNSMSDLFFEEFSDEQIAAGLGVMAACPQHDFLILTKRPERMLEWFGWIQEQVQPAPGCWDHEILVCIGMALKHVPGFSARSDKLIYRIRSADAYAGRAPMAPPYEWPLPNVWLGTSCEDQQRADERIPVLLQCPAAVHFVSAEPLLGPIDIVHKLGDVCTECSRKPQLHLQTECPGGYLRRGIDWVIIGSESGPGARAMQVEWARSIVRQCRDAGVAVFTKQIANAVDRKGGDPYYWPPGDWPRQFPEVQQA